MGAISLDQITGLGSAASCQSSQFMSSTNDLSEVSAAGGAHPAASRANLGLSIGSNVEAWSANLDSWSAVAPSSYSSTSAIAAIYAPLASPTFTGTVTVPTLAPTNITGTTTNNNAASGAVGETIASALPAIAAQALTTNTPKNVTSISLTAGDWDVSGNINLNGNGLTSTGKIGGISTTSVTLPSDGSECYSGLQLVLTSATDSIMLPPKRISLASTTTVYLVAQATFFAGTCGVFGSITARRTR